jgi:transcriptional regulator of NAD metabolism
MKAQKIIGEVINITRLKEDPNHIIYTWKYTFDHKEKTAQVKEKASCDEERGDTRFLIIDENGELIKVKHSHRIYGMILFLFLLFALIFLLLVKVPLF